MSLVERFDDWVASGPFTPADLGTYRIVYAVCALLIAPNIAWLGQLPDFMYHPPPGPLSLLSSFPSPTTLIVLEVLRSTTLILLGLGLWTRYVSIAASVMLVVTYGLTYCLGKVDHSILMVLPPLVLAFANWGDRFSIDALRRRGEPRSQQQWPLRLLALLIGWGFFVAALTKIVTGWLSFSSQAARGYFVLGFLTEDRTNWLAGWVAAHDVRSAWELVDWVTVAFELSILIALPWWRAFRIAIAVATTFHLGVLLVMNIDFSHAVVPYGAFVSWGVVTRRMGDVPIATSVSRCAKTRFAGTGGRAVLCLIVATIAGAVLFLTTYSAGKTLTQLVFSDSIIVIGAAIGLWYLTLQARSVVRTAVSRRHPKRPGGDSSGGREPAQPNLSAHGPRR